MTPSKCFLRAAKREWRLIPMMKSTGPSCWIQLATDGCWEQRRES